MLFTPFYLYSRHLIQSTSQITFFNILKMGIYGGETSITLKTILEKDVSSLSSPIQCEGWIRTVRKQKNISFVQIYDGSSRKDLQLVLSREDMGGEVYDNLLPLLSTGSSIHCKGYVKGVIKNNREEKKKEVLVNSMKVYCSNDHLSYPLQKKKHSTDFLRTLPHLRHHTRIFSTIFHMRSRISEFVHDYFKDKGFHLIHTPVITPLDCEGAGELFKVSQPDTYQKESPLFKSESFLTVSGQLYAEALCQGLGRVYNFAPTFRAEKSHTSRHLAEFWMIEPELPFCDLNDIIKSVSDFISKMGEFIINYPDQLKDLSSYFNNENSEFSMKRVELLLKGGYHEISYSEALKIVNRKSGTDFVFGYDFQRKEEKFLCEYIGGPLFIRDFPSCMKPFYMRENSDGKTSASVDLLLPSVGEVVGGGQREERYDILKRKMERMGLLEDGRGYEWYLDLRRFGSAPHGGYGVGFERLLSYMLGVPNIRDVIPFPRYSGQKL